VKKKERWGINRKKERENSGRRHRLEKKRGGPARKGIEDQKK